MTKKKAVSKTIEEKQALIARIESLKASGMSGPEACKAVGVIQKNYYNYKNQIKAAAKTTVVTYPNTEAKPTRVMKPKASMRLIAIVGDADQVMAALRGL